MRRITSFIAFLFVISLLVSLNNRAYACTCWTPRPPCEEYWQAEAVFVGQVTAIKLNQDERDWGPVQVSFTIQETLRGITGERIEVRTGMGGGDCGYGFQRGGLYLVYAQRNKETGRLSTSSCSRTQRFAEDSNDMLYIRSLAKAKSGTFIFGKIMLAPYYYGTQDSEQRPQPLANLPVTIEGKERRFSATTDADGSYRLEGLPPGEYKVLIEQPPAGVLANEPAQVKLSDKGCGEVSFWLRREGGRLRGKLFGPQGQLVPGVQIFLASTDKNNNWRESALTTDDGSYEFKEIPPGTYRANFKHLGLAKGERVTPSFHPATRDPEQAALIVIGEGQKLDDYPMQVSAFATERTVEGVAVDASGQPIPNCIVAYGIPNEALGSNVRADGRGRFSFKVYEGVKYYASVTIEKGKDKYEYYNWVEVPQAEGVKQFRLVASERRE